MRIHWIGLVAALLLATARAESPDGAAGETPSDVATEQDDVKVEAVPDDVSETAEPTTEATDEPDEPAEWKYDKNGILILTRVNFDAAIDAHDHLFVVFHTPACSQCIALHPHFVEAWKALRERQPDLQFAKIDCTNETALLVHYGITQYPTLTFFKSQKEKMYDGGYRSVDIEAWVEKRMGDPARPIESVDQLEALRAEHEVFAVGFFKDPDSVSTIIFLRVADAVHDYPFFVVVDPEIFRHYELEEDTVVVFKQFDDGRVDFPATDYVADDLMSFLRLETFPLVSELSMENVWRVTEEANVIKSHFLLFRNASDPAAPKDVREMVLPAAKKYKGDILFLLIDMADRRMFHMEEFFGVHRDRTPAMRIFRYEGPTYKFRPSHEDGSVSTDQILQFCDDFKTGKLTAFKLSQPLPDDWDAADVKVLTAQNFNEVTGDASRHVFVMLYAPWCPHCQLVTPIFEKLAERYQSHAGAISFAKMDATANEVDDLEFGSYPTFYLYVPGGERQQFNGSRTLSDFVGFLNEHTTVKLELDEGEAGETAEPAQTGQSGSDGACSAGAGDESGSSCAARAETSGEEKQDASRPAAEDTTAKEGETGDGPSQEQRDEL